MSGTDVDGKRGELVASGPGPTELFSPEAQLAIDGSPAYPAQRFQVLLPNLDPSLTSDIFVTPDARVFQDVSTGGAIVRGPSRSRGRGEGDLVLDR